MPTKRKHSLGKTLARPWIAAVLALGVGLALGAGLTLFLGETPSASKIETTHKEAARRPVPKVAGLPAAKPGDFLPGEASKPQWIRNAVAVPENGERPLIAIVIDDLGLSPKRSAMAIGLPGPLTLAFLPYAAKLPEQARRARAAGHELLVHVPMEPEGKVADPGPRALMTRMSVEEILERLRWDLDRFDHYVGINNHMGSKFTKNPERLALVFQELKSRGLLFLDSRTTSDTVARELAGEMGIPFAERQVFLDNYLSAKNVHERLARLEEIARNEGVAVAIGHPHEVTMAALREWLPTLEEKGFALVPVSAVVRKRLDGQGAVTGR
ncbi:MAG: divergent polysaccharide deacetylase family protein [Alphaproteobacteria bacterium]|nr:divergent polysaccharide deacetylase family protein [Alphaproteobacteria bacterium]